MTSKEQAVERGYERTSKALQRLKKKLGTKSDVSNDTKPAQNDKRCLVLIMILSANQNKLQLFVAPLVAKFNFLQINLIIFSSLFFWCEVYIDLNQCII